MKAEARVPVAGGQVQQNASGAGFNSPVARFSGTRRY
jgi:hypothetical protein